MQLRGEAWKKFRTSTGLNPWPRDTGAMLYQLSYEATDVGSRSIVSSYVPVKEMSQWFLSSVGRASHRYREVTDSNPVEVQNFFFQASLLNCINCVHCDDHFFISISFPQFIYDLFHISLTIRVLLVFRWWAVSSWQWTRWTGWIKRKTSFPPGNIKTLPSSASTYTLPWE